MLYLFIILLIITILFIILDNYNLNYEHISNTDNIDNTNINIIISRYNEDLNWLNEYPFNEFKVIVYNKGVNDDYLKSPNIIKTIKLPNVGRECHTFLYHIIENYDNLADITIFLSGSINNSNKYYRSIDLINSVKKSKNTVFSCLPSYLKVFLDYDSHNFKINSYLSSDSNNKTINNDSSIKFSEIRPYGEWYKSTFKNNEENKCYSLNSIFAVSKKNILQKPKYYYENLITQLNDHPNPEAGHFFERSWYAIFYPYDEIITETSFINIIKTALYVLYEKIML